MLTNKFFQDDKNAFRLTLILLGFIFLLKLVFVFSSIDLGVDEAHYVLYAKYPALSYFDHPPMVGWLQIIPLWISKQDWVFRVLPLLLTIIIPLQIYLLSIKIFPDYSKWLAFLAVAVNQMQFFSFGSILSTPQLPLIVSSLSYIYFFYNIIFYNNLTISPFLLCGIFAGFAALSDYHAIFLIFSSCLSLIFYKKYYLVKDWRLWLMVLVAIAVSSPVFIWNFYNDFVSFKFQFNHGLPSNKNWSFYNFIISQLLQLIVYTPFVFFIGYYALFKELYKNNNVSSVYLSLFIIPVMGIFLYSSGYNKVFPHWISLVWTEISILVALYLFNNWKVNIIRKFFYFSFSFSLIVASIASFIIIFPWVPISIIPPSFKKTPIYKYVYGWKEAAIISKQEISVLPEKYQKLYVASWINASRISWYSGLPVQVIGTDNIYQFDYWYGRPKNHDNGLVVIQSHKKLSYGAGQRNAFESCKLIRNEDIYKFGILVNKFNFYLCDNYQV